MSGAAVHDQVLDGSSHTRLGSAKRERRLASDGMTADHGPQLPQAEQLRTWNRAVSPNGRFSRERSQPVPRKLDRLRRPGAAAGVDRDDLQAGRARVDPVDVAVPRLLVHPVHPTRRLR